MRTPEYWKEHTKKLQPLKVGDIVWTQNQTGPEPKKRNMTDFIVFEVRQYDQYVVKVDGSGRATLRNRKFLRVYTPLHLQQGSKARFRCANSTVNALRVINMLITQALSSEIP